MIEKCKRCLPLLEKSVHFSGIASNSEDENDHHTQDKQHSPSIINDGSSLLDDDACDYQEYHDDEHDDTKTAIDIEYCFLDRFPPLYNGSRAFSMKSMKLLMDFLISDVCLDKQNILCLLKLIKFLLSELDTLPTTLKSIIKLFERTNLSSTTFLYLLCHE